MLSAFGLETVSDESSHSIIGIIGVMCFSLRKLFWLFVAAVGFALGIQIAPHLVHEPSPALALTFALVLGFAGAGALWLPKGVAIGCGQHPVGTRSSSPSH